MSAVASHFNICCEHGDRLTALEVITCYNCFPVTMETAIDSVLETLADVKKL
jgi:hypothetical protein